MMESPKQLELPLLVVIDPGTICGWAVYREGRLIGCGYAGKERFIWTPLVVQSSKASFLIERPRIYPVKRQKSPPNDILELDFLAGQIETVYRLAGVPLIEFVYPKTWKGTIPKPAKGQEYIVERRVFKRLDEREKQVIQQTKSARAVGLNHNAVDAVAIGLWKLERWT